jgi:branched-chain amino acid aminotransferase
MRVKCNANYQNGRLAAVQAEADGYDTAILLNSRGKVSEGPSMCFFMIRDGKAITPGTSNDILESITRQTMLDILPEMCGVEVIERDVDRSELLMAEEAFFCGTAWEVTPVTSIDRVPLGTGEVGPIVKKLQQSYFDLTNGRTNLHPDWLTKVY